MSIHENMLVRVAALAAFSSVILVRHAPAADCAGCHPAEARAHASTAHASSLVAASQSAFAAHLRAKPLAEAADGYMFTYQITPLGLLATAQRGADRAQGLIQWVLGSGRRGQTPLIESDGRYLEHRVSFYAEPGSYGITTGQANGKSPNARKALGTEQSAKDLRSCLDCHTTGLPERLSLPITAADFIPGVQCERCHAGAAEHAEQAKSGRKPVNPGKLSAAAQVSLCGTCHRNVPPNGHDDDVANVRFQPLRLIKSRCFLEGKAACTTCHPAHHDALHNQPPVYNAKCAGCHGMLTQHVAAQRSADCIACHMPRSRPHPALEFTDHFIRVVTDKK